MIRPAPLEASFRVKTNDVRRARGNATNYLRQYPGDPPDKGMYHFRVSEEE